MGYDNDMGQYIKEKLENESNQTDLVSDINEVKVTSGKVPVVVPSRADTKHSKLASIMAAVVAANN